KVGRDFYLDEAVLARDSEGLIHLLVRYPEDFKGEVPALGGPLECNRRPWPIAQGEIADVLDVILLERLLPPTFVSLIGELLDRMERSGRSAMGEVSAGGERWRQALARRSQRPTREAVRGLSGAA